MRISVIIPAHNEADFIGDTIKLLVDSGKADEIIVVDDGSSDETGKIAKEAGALVIKHEKNQGKGAALNSAAPFVTGDIVVLLDADLGKSAGKFQKLIEPIKNGSADVTVAVFPPPPVAGGFGLVKGLAAEGVYRLTGKQMKAVLSGQRGMTKAVFQNIIPFASGFGVEVASSIDILRQGWRVKEIEIELIHDFSGRNIAGFIHRGRQFFDICRVLVKKL